MSKNENPVPVQKFTESYLIAAVVCGVIRPFAAWLLVQTLATNNAVPRAMEVLENPTADPAKRAVAQKEYELGRFCYDFFNH